MLTERFDSCKTYVLALRDQITGIILLDFQPYQFRYRCNLKISLKDETLLFFVREYSLYKNELFL